MTDLEKRTARLAEVTRKTLDVSEEDFALIPLSSLEDVRKLFSVAVFIKNNMSQGGLKNSHYFSNQTESLFDLIVKGDIDRAIGIVECAAGGQVYVPLPPEHMAALVTGILPRP